ncbi:MAG: hypothetical protein KatS3mg102_1932 [Planctomycetota bacterium]|nr:MAG: hypothetical protein KatS3mg102_1932 [Planctomycetota bacterium]
MSVPEPPSPLPVFAALLRGLGQQLLEAAQQLDCWAALQRARGPAPASQAATPASPAPEPEIEPVLAPAATAHQPLQPHPPRPLAPLGEIAPPPRPDAEWLPSGERVVEVLSACGVKVRRRRELEPGWLALGSLARNIGRKYRHVRPLLHQLKRHQGDGRRIAMQLRQLPQQQVADLTLVCTEAYRLGLLPSYRYLRSPRFLLYTDPPQEPRGIEFFTGGWLELFAVHTALELLRHARTSDPEVDLACGLEIVLPNGDQAELDVGLVHQKALIWIEGKTGCDFNAHLPRYRALRDLLRLPRERALLLVSDFQPDAPQILSRARIAEMTACTPASLAGALAALLAPLPEQAPAAPA